MLNNVVVKVIALELTKEGKKRKSKEDLDALLFDRVARRNRTDSYDEKKYRGAGLKEALSDKETVAQSEVDAFMENCAKRWQTRESTPQLKRRRLPDVRDSPEYSGTAGKQKWSLILPSSARVSELTYVTIIGTRYPELDNFQNDIIQFGNYLQAEQCTRGGFLPIFWDAPYSYINASTDTGEVVDWITDKFVVANKGDLAVLHNRNKMVNAFANTEWVSGSGGAIISRSVTSCAGMTAYLVLLAQTRVGFLSGGRGKSFHQLPPQEQAAQREEAYARATVAVTRAQQICFIMGPLDMRGLVGAATIIGCLKYGASFSGLDDQDDPVFLIRLKDEDLLEAPDDSAFLQSLRFSCARVSGVYPPLALVEAYITEEDSAPRVRRLHLMVVDLHRRRRMADRVLRLLVDIQVDRHIPVERKTPAAKREVDQDMVATEESVSDAESGWSGVSDNSSTDSECTDVEASSVASDQDRFDTAYDAFRDLANGLYHIDLRRYSRGITTEDAAGVPLLDGQEKLQELVHLPRTWPLARLTIPLEGLSKQIDRLLEGYCFQILATNRNPEAHNGRVLQTATHLTWILAEYLADTIAWLMRSILGHDSKILFDKDTQLLLTPKFWILPLYREFLNSARRIRPSPSSERARGYPMVYGGGFKAPTGKSKEELDTLLFDKAARRNRTDPYEEKKYRGARIKEVQAWWKRCQDWMAHYKKQSEPFVYDFKKLLKALSDKEAVAQSEVDAFMENCAKRWQTREGTYQLKRRRLKLSIQLQILIWLTSKHGQRGGLLHGGREPLRG
eukprot:symbB.v1.2.010124.t1/scaffold618.1/size180184/1